MKLNQIQIQNYRCFENLDFSLDSQLTLFVGKNGAGKSTILDAIAIAVSTFLCEIDGGVSRNIQKEDARYRFYEMEGVVDAQHQFPVVIAGTGECDGKQPIKWTRSLNSAGGKTTIKDAHQLTDIAQQMQMKVMSGDKSVILPILSYYGTGRLYAQKKEKRDLKTLQKFSRQVGYLDCMAAESNEKMMLNWFEKMTMKSLQNQQKTGHAEKIQQLQAVERAVCRSFQQVSGAEDAELSFDLDTHRLILEYRSAEGEKLKYALNEMSDGYKNTMSMIGDIAYRMAVLNPQLGERVLEETPGIVLIDEIDLHLHPEWQQSILNDLQEIFPKVQFVITSHAPAVIHSVQREKIRILDHGHIYEPAEQTYGRDANSILREVMQVGERPEP
ncbi:MAG: AAA family ATPase, partial [Lachnospiraceae bacterium]|nr:AAA family ATPase [Lachnospiraceae bacterium]